jgi:hypothetical protein
MSDRAVVNSGNNSLNENIIDAALLEVLVRRHKYDWKRIGRSYQSCNRPSPKKVIINQSEFYDLTINPISLLSLTEGWKINFNTTQYFDPAAFYPSSALKTQENLS